MKIIPPALLITFICSYLFSQAQPTKSICSYYSLSDSSDARIKIVIDKGKPDFFYLGKIPSITVNKVEKKVRIEILTDKPFKKSSSDSLLFSLFPFHTVTMEYDIINEIGEAELQGYNIGYLLSPCSHGAMAILLFKSRAASNIYDAVLMPQTDEGIDITSNFLVIEDCKYENLKKEQKNLDNVNSSGLGKTSIQFNTYTNSWGYKIDYPSFLIMNPNKNTVDDGRDFASKDGMITVNVYAGMTYSRDDQSNKSIAIYYDKDINDKSLSITYKALKSNWYVLSGINNKNGKVFYKKVFFSNIPEEKIYPRPIRTMVIEYPQSLHEDFDTIILRMAQSFVDIQ